MTSNGKAGVEPVVLLQARRWLSLAWLLSRAGTRELRGGREGEGEGESRGAGEPGKGGLAGKGGVAGEEGAAPGEAPVEAAPVYRERRESVVVRVLVERSMPERQQAQLIRALERHVAWKRPLVGWSDLYPLPRPLDVTDLQELLKT